MKKPRKGSSLERPSAVYHIYNVIDDPRTQLILKQLESTTPQRLAKGPKVKRTLFHSGQHKTALQTPSGLDKVQIFDEMLKESLNDEEDSSSMHFTLGKYTIATQNLKVKAESMPLSQHNEST